MERVLLLKGNHKMRLTVESFKKNKQRYEDMGWRVADLNEVVATEAGELIEDEEMKPKKPKRTKVKKPIKDAIQEKENDQEEKKEDL